MDPMQKMWASFVAIGLMVIASLLITYARHKFERGVIRFTLSVVAFVLLGISIVYMVFSL